MHVALITGILWSFTSACLADEAFENTGLNEPSHQRESILSRSSWIHGSADCAINSDAAIDVYRHDQKTYIFRQNKCLSFEAPFIYVLVGANKVLILDTGATEDPSAFPLFYTIQSVLGPETIATKEILVVHSHSHSDHYKGDLQFREKPKITLVDPNAKDMKSFFGFREWPLESASLELGGRKLVIIPTPGHQEEAISIYDPHTKWLLTGDTVYPGYIYVKNWEDYKSSIARLASFTDSYDVSAILGSHIEMTSEPGQYYPIGTTFQPDEAALELGPEDIHKLNKILQESDEEQELVFDNFIVAPMNLLQKTLSNIARWITQ